MKTHIAELSEAVLVDGVANQEQMANLATIDEPGAGDRFADRPAAVDWHGPASSRQSVWALSARSLKWVLCGGDLAVIMSAIAMLWVRTGEPALGISSVVAIAVAQVVGLYLVEAYDKALYLNHQGLPTRLMLACGISAGIMGAGSLLAPGLGLTRLVASGYFLCFLPLLLLWRWGGASWVRSMLPPRRVAVVGAGRGVDEVAAAISADPYYELCGVFGSVDAKMVQTYEAAGDAQLDQTLASEISAGRVEMIVVAASERERADLFDALVKCRYRGIEVQDAATCFELLEQRLPIEYVEDGWVAFSARFEGWSHEFEQKAKRLLDVAVAATGILVAGPVMLLIAILVRLTSPGPALFRQVRVGRWGLPYVIYKFRSMRLDAERTGAVWALKDDPRSTRFGGWLRRTHLDELPQLFNVLRGEMSLVGPRPERPEFVGKLRDQIPYYDLRHVIKPGVTGWAQVRYPYGSSVQDAATKLEYDLYYIRHRNLLWDLRILLRTLTVSVAARGSR